MCALFRYEMGPLINGTEWPKKFEVESGPEFGPKQFKSAEIVIEKCAGAETWVIFQVKRKARNLDPKMTRFVESLIQECMGTSHLGVLRRSNLDAPSDAKTRDLGIARGLILGVISDRSMVASRPLLSFIRVNTCLLRKLSLCMG